MTPEVLALVSRELNTVHQSARNQLPSAEAAKIDGHLNLARRLLKGEPVKKFSQGKADPAKREALRLRVFTAYGGRCACCGETNARALTVDHIKPIRKRRKRPKDIYKKLLREGCPRDKYQVLCLNCNTLKGTDEVCPHRAANKTRPPTEEGRASHEEARPLFFVGLAVDFYAPAGISFPRYSGFLPLASTRRPHSTPYRP